MNYVIRLLVPTDREEWLRLRVALWPDASMQSQYDEMAEILRTFDRQPVFVAVRGEAGAAQYLCGLMEVTIHITPPPGCTTQRVGYLEAWYVDPDCRKYGIGRKLVEAAEAWSRTQGCTEMASDTNPGYPISPTAHQKLGYEIVLVSDGDVFFRKELRTYL